MVPGQEAQQHQQEWLRLQLQLGTGAAAPLCQLPRHQDPMVQTKAQSKGTEREQERERGKRHCKIRTDRSQAGFSQLLQGRTCARRATLQVPFTASFTIKPAFRNLRKCPKPMGHSNAPSPAEFPAARKPSASGGTRDSGLAEPGHCPGCQQSQQPAPQRARERARGTDSTSEVRKGEQRRGRNAA